MSRKTTSEPEFGAEKWLYSLRGKNRGKAQVSDFDHPPEGSPAPLDAARPQRINGKVVTSGRQGMASQEETRRMGRAALEDGLGRGSYVVGAQWDEGNMVHAMRRFGGTTVGWRFGDG